MTSQKNSADIIAQLKTSHERRQARAKAEAQAHDVLVRFAQSNAGGIDSGVDIEAFHKFLTGLFLEGVNFAPMKAGMPAGGDDIFMQSIEALTEATSQIAVRLDDIEATLSALVKRDNPADVIRDVGELLIRTDNKIAARLGKVEEVLVASGAFQMANIKPDSNEDPSDITNTGDESSPGSVFGALAFKAIEYAEDPNTTEEIPPQEEPETPRERVPQFQTLSGAFASTAHDYQQSLFPPDEIPTRKVPLKRTVGAYASMSPSERKSAEIRDVLADLVDSYKQPVPIKLVIDELAEREIDLSHYSDATKYVAGSLQNHSLRFGDYGWWPTSRAIPERFPEYRHVKGPRNKIHRHQGKAIIVAYNKRLSAAGLEPLKWSARQGKDEDLDDRTPSTSK